MNSKAFESLREAEVFANTLRCSEHRYQVEIRALSYWDELTYHGQWVVIWSDGK